ncbi:hypothetical protein JHG24_004683 [Salmonella enterica subsp. enterica serovar Infantis]|uniref:Uncharacterized protein n=3 Tax=Salmonella enterica TaxID=28901 RepID=A0A5Y5GYW1_SALER|nr:MULTISPECIES: hypothetical protein [Salmonella]EAM5917598.1 hypothetical protein [Salmonella enterica]EGX8022140.1 hypothetical protein [Salmonella enterica subsp. enterica serovar Isangi]EAM7453544.1 hypothetical protein [Salmonella enterica]EAO8699949.1 hypothetical protein [Salmonella enterica]EAQ5350015.1 hypothetical protein [Salmonella enterica]
MKNSFNKIYKKESPESLLRTHCISVRLNQDELQLLNKKRGDKSKGEWLRLSLLNKLPAVVPAINIQAWKTLGEISQKLNKIVAHLDSKSQGSSLTKTELFVVKRQISELRLNLITANLWGASNEGNAEDKAR